MQALGVRNEGHRQGNSPHWASWQVQPISGSHPGTCAHGPGTGVEDVPGACTSRAAALRGALSCV